jgi:hypothetical protein
VSFFLSFFGVVFGVVFCKFFTDIIEAHTFRVSVNKRRERGEEGKGWERRGGKKEGRSNGEWNVGEVE